MNNTELQINGRYVDTGGDLGVRLNRKIIDPGALNTQDAQYSYSIVLPFTQRNVIAFNYATVEETRNKFNTVYNASLTINSVRIFVGLFRLTGIDGTGIKGNLYLPVPKTVKDIFGDQKLNANPAYNLPFSDFATYVNQYNEAAELAPQAAIFPYILYGVIPKVPINRDTNAYSARTLWDSSVRLGIQDLPPAINALIMLKHIFNSNGYALQGNAFQDARLAGLYQTYKNASDYVQPWNYGKYAQIEVSGQWSNWVNQRDPGAGTQPEHGAFYGDNYSTDFFDCTNAKINVVNDPGGNVLYNEILDDNELTWVNSQISIPVSGLYKISFNASLHVATDNMTPIVDPLTDIQFISGAGPLSTADMTNNIFEIRVMRDNGTGDFGLSNGTLDGNFYEKNQPQNNIFDANNIPKYFPQVDANGQVNFIDKVTDTSALLGFRFGGNPSSGMENPQDTAGVLAQVQAAKPALSYDNSFNEDPPVKLAIKAPGYWKYGRIGDFDTPGENPDADIDYSSAARVNDMALDGSGNPTVSEPGDVALVRFPLDRYYTYTINGTADYVGYAYIHDGATNVTPLLIAAFVDGIATFDTSFVDMLTVDPRLTIMLTTPALDVDGTLSIARTIDSASEDVIGWEVSNKYKIDLINAPDNFAKRGMYADASADVINNGQGSANAVVWLNAGELITVAAVTQQGVWRDGGSHSTFGYVRQNAIFDLTIVPFRTDEAWVLVSDAGDGTGVMDWDAPGNFDTDTINLVGFLDADTATDDYIDNFCKLYNLVMSQVNATTFSLDVRQTKTATSNQFVDLDKIASLAQRENTPLGIPSEYDLGFTIDTEEEGFVETGDTGGGVYLTGATEQNVVSQTSSFSYNWYKNITKVESGGNIIISLPIVSKSEAWALGTSYPDAMSKRYTDQAQRFMYAGGILAGTYTFNGDSLKIANVRNDIPGLSILNYRDAPYTILDNYFTLLISGASHYTNINAYLTPRDYVLLDGSRSVRFNGDLYFIAELDGFDPYGRNQTKIMLIRKI